MLPHDLLDQFADALIGVTPIGVVSFWNRGAQAMFGWSAEEANGRLLAELVVPEGARAAEAARIAQVGAGDVTYEAVRQRRDGTLIHTDVSLRPVRGPDGEVTGVAISTKDISHLRSLRDAEVVAARFGDVLEATPDAMLLVNAAGRIVLANSEAERLFGWARDQLVGQVIEVLVPSRYHQAHPVHRAGYAADPRTRPMGAGIDLFAQRRDGTEFAAEISLARVPIAGGSALTSVAVRDVGARRKIENKFRGLLEAAPDAMVIVDPDGRIVLVNAQAERVFGYTRAELVGESVDRLVPPRDRARHAGHRAAFFQEPRTRSMGSGIELQAVRSDGTSFPVEVSLSPLETEDGTLVSAAIRDVSDRRRTEEALRLVVQELEAFSYSVAHDLRAPLRGMSGFAQILLEEYGDRFEADGLDCLNEIRNNAVRMGALIDGLLSLSRVTRSELHPDEVDLAAMARASVAACAVADPGRAVEFVVPDRLLAWADPVLARALVENLLGNAWKFTRGRGDTRIEFGVEDHDGARCFFVRDNGAGFDPTYASRLFGPFQRLHTEAEFPGTGIGLATAQRIVRRHGGDISADGTVGHGATFRFTLAERPAT